MAKPALFIEVGEFVQRGFPRFLKPLFHFSVGYESKPVGQKKREVGQAVPFGLMGTARDLTGMAIFLATAEADYIVAQTYNVDGGNWMS